MDQNSSSNLNQQQQSTCSCTATANLALMRKEMERYKAMYEREKEQFEEFQRYSKELESEMELELKQRDRKLSELDAGRRRMVQEMDMLKTRGEQQRQEQQQTEEHMKQQMVQMRDQLVDLRQKLRAVEQANDDMERRERINSQQLVDIRARYDQCLERLALFEAGMIGPESQNQQQPLSPAFSSLLNNGNTNADGTFSEMGTDEEHSNYQSLLTAGMDSSGTRHSTPRALANRFSSSSGSGGPSIQHVAAHLAANRETNKLIDSMLRKVDAFESQFFRYNGIGSNAPSTSSTPIMMNGHNSQRQQYQQQNNGNA